MDDNTAAVKVLVPIFGIFCVFGLPVAAFIFFRIMAHRERMEMIRQGMVPARGMGRGAAAAPGAHASEWAAGNRCGPGMPPDVALARGIRLTFIGLAITIGLSFIGYHHDEMHFGPWLLGGLIPLFIGLSQVVIAVLSGATLGPARNGGTTGFGGIPPDAGEAAPRDPQTYEGPYTYRPGSAQELRRPASPPERRP